MSRLTESGVTLALIVIALVLTGVGIAANIAGFTDPDTMFLTALGVAVLAVAVSIDEQRLSHAPSTHPIEEWFGRGFIALAGILQIVGFIMGLMDDETRNLWSVMGVVLALVGLCAAIDSHRVSVAHRNRISHQTTDALGGVICAAFAFGLGIFGFFTGLFGLPHGEAWLFGAVVFGVAGVAFMLDEHVSVTHRARHQTHVPFKAK